MLSTDKEKLLQLAKNCYNISKTVLEICDADQNPICAYPNKMSDFCTEVRKSPQLAKKCIECDAEAFLHCKEKKSLYSYKCHMGLVEVAMPIVANNVVIGFLLIGQFTDQKDRTELKKRILETASKYGLNTDVIDESFEKIRYRSDSYIESLSKLLEMCANYIWLNSIISFKNNSVAYSMQHYISSHIQDDLSIDALCYELNLSRSSIYNISKKYFGCGISQYVQKCKLEKAKSLLENTDTPIGELSSQLGFLDTNYFIRSFKKQEGITPKKYRDSRQKNVIHH